MATTTLYGISNCDTVRKAKRWLSDHDVEFSFHDFRKDGVNTSMVRAWEKALGWETMLNKRGTTWRKLPERAKTANNAVQATKLMVEYPTVIKRPILQVGTKFHIGFSESDYKTAFK